MTKTFVIDFTCDILVDAANEKEAEAKFAKLMPADIGHVVLDCAQITEIQEVPT